MLVFMRWTFALLLLGNIAFFSAMQLPQDKASSDTLASHTPYQAEKIRLIAEGEMPLAPPSPLAPPAEQVCLEWGLFAEAELTTARTALKTLKLDDNNIDVRNTPVKASTWWVFIPPQKTRQDAIRKVEELRALGVQDSFVMQDDNKWRYAVSLGVFSSREGAEKFLAQTREKGVRSAKSAPRNPEGGYASILIKSIGANVEEALVKLRQDFPATELKAVACSQ